MPCDLRGYRIFIATPGGLRDERRAFRSAISAYNESDAHADGVHFFSIGWEETLGGTGRPQALINEDLVGCDYSVIILWNRWGSSADLDGAYSSGTHEEYELALKCLRDNSSPMRDVIVFFKGVDAQALSDPGPQLQQVLDFRKQLETEKQILFETFDTVEDFQARLRRHLSHWRRLHLKNALGDGRIIETDPASSTRTARLSHDSEDHTGREKTATDISDRPTTEERPTTAALADLDAEVRVARRLAAEGRIVEAEQLLARLTTSTSSPAAYRAFAGLMMQVGRLTQAEEHAAQAFQIDKQNHDALAMAADEMLLARIAIWRERGDDAERFLRRAARRYQVRKAPALAAELYLAWSRKCFTFDDAPNAVKFARRALRYAPKTDDLLVARVKTALATALGDSPGEVDEAHALFAQAVAMSKDDPETLATINNNWALIFQVQKDYAHAEERFLLAADLWYRLGDKKNHARALSNHAELDLEIGRLDRSLASLRATFQAFDGFLSCRFFAMLAIATGLVDADRHADAIQLVRDLPPAGMLPNETVAKTLSRLFSALRDKNANSGERFRQAAADAGLPIC